MNARLQDIHDLKSDILAQVAHELRTPVTAIGCAAKAIQRRNGSETAKAMDFTIAILPETEHLTSIIDPPSRGGEEGRSKHEERTILTRECRPSVVGDWVEPPDGVAVSRPRRHQSARSCDQR
jgi:signal transduction histidine kinase